MARWRAKCWLGSSAGYQDLEVAANTLNGAKEQLQRIYGAEQIINLHQVRESSSSSSGGSSEISWEAIGLIVLVIIFLAYWWIIVPVGVLGGIGWFFFVRGNDNE